MKSAKNKILYVITKSNWGGAQRYVFDLATNLPRERFNIMVAAGGNGHLISKLKEAGVATITIPHLERDINPLKEALSLWSLFKIFRRERPDIVHLNSSKIGGLGAVAAQLAGVPKIIFTAHGWAFQEPRTSWQRASIIFLSWLAARFQNHIINISKKDFDATLAWRIASAKKTAFIPLGIKRPKLLPKEEARKFISEKSGFRSMGQTTLIGTIAELTNNKGLNHLIDAVNQVKIQNPKSKIQTIIVGEGEKRERLQNQIHALGLEDTVRLAGFIPDAAQYLKAFDVFVLPSLKEGLPYTLLEALSAGIPAIATSVGGIPDVIRDGKNGILVPPKNATRLAGAIAEVIRNSDKRALLMRDIEESAPGKDSFETMLAKTTELYEI